MTNETRRYTAEEITTAARDLQDAAGSPEVLLHVPEGQDFNVEQAINLLSAEIRILRERGFSNERIADLFTSFDIEATAADIEDFYERDKEDN